MSTYALDNAWSDARRRLGLLDECLGPMTLRRFSALGSLEGLHCLEIGAGLGHTAHWLSREVGAAGRVVATDIDTRFMEPLQADNLEVWRHDVCNDPLPDCSFDLIHARWLFYHLREPASVLERLRRALKPGGILLIEDVDFFPLHQASCKAYSRFMLSLARAVGTRAGHDGEWAASALPQLLSTPQWTGLRVDAQLDVLRGQSSMAKFWQLTAQQMHEALQADFGSDRESLRLALNQLEDPSFWSYSTAHIAVSAQPAAVR